jgi:DNA mismatch endonuclease (patch repair protein)
MEMVIVADIFSKDKRSDIMKSIKGKNTKIENITAEWLHFQGFEFTMYDKELPGKPDFVLPKYKTVIFTHGCFWHGHENCKASELPATNREFWEEKIGKNKERDERNRTELEKAGWKVLTVWQCELRNASEAEKRLIYLVNEILDPGDDD